MRFIRFILLVCFALGTCLLRAQVYNVDANQDANTIVVTYLLTEKSDITLHVSTDGGITFSKALKSVSGDVGKNISTGQKRIVWNVLDEYDSFSFSEVCFSVEAKPIRKKTKKTATAKTPLESNVYGLEYTIPVGLCYYTYTGKKRVGVYAGLDFGVGYNTKSNEKDFTLAVTVGPKIGLTPNVAWIVGVGFSEKFSTPISIKNMFSFVLETGFAFRVSRILFSARCQYMLPHSVVVPLVGVGLVL